ncbi:MAG: glycosyltransferase family 2 protein [Burkholderiaceae bacterium]
MTALALLLLLPCLVLLVPVGVVCAQVALACLPRRPEAEAGTGPRPRLTVLVPAHNERDGIARTLRSVRPQLREGDRLLVVADNCDDDTADIARAEGASVVERQHASDRGKGFALAFGVEQLRAAPPDVLVVIDADCEIGAQALDRLARACARSGRPAQALDLMTRPDGAGVGLRVAEFAWRVKNWVRPRGGSAMGWPCPLMGTGMALPWPLVESARLAHGHLAEDMQLGVDLALAGHAAVFCEAATVVSQFPLSKKDQDSQRTRWEHGHLGTIRQQLPALLKAAWARRDGRLLAMALDLSVPPLALLVMLVVALWLAALALRLAGGAPAVAWYAANGLCAALLAAVLLAWAVWGRAVLRPWDLLGIPWYVASKLGLYLRFWTRPQRQWVRTGRHPGDQGPAGPT